MRRKTLFCLGLAALCGVYLGVRCYLPERIPPSVSGVPTPTSTSTPSRLRTLWTLGRLAIEPTHDDASSTTQRAAAPADDPLAEERRIADSGALHAVVEKARLDRDETRAIAHILEMHARNQASLKAALAGDEQLATLQEQTLGDTVAQLRTHIPDSAWEAFARSGLLAVPALGEARAAAAKN